MLFGSGFILLVAIGVFVWAAVDAFTADPEKVRGLPKTVWVIIILFGLWFGAIAWFIFGRPRRTAMARVRRDQSWGGANPTAPRRSSPIAPDDDPEFLLRLREQLRKKPDDDPHA
jgi:cytochrome c-type biogenesis protein CcmH/NrfG